MSFSDYFKIVVFAILWLCTLVVWGVAVVLTAPFAWLRRRR